MTAVELKQIISNEVDQKEISNWHGFTKDNLDIHLVEPEIIELDIWGSETIKFWKVFDEQPYDIESGYLVIYDDNNESFCLATKSSIKTQGSGIIIGFYGSFVDALNAM